MLFVVVIMIYPDRVIILSLKNPELSCKRRVGYNEDCDEMVSFVIVSNFSRWQITTAEVAVRW